MSNKCEEHLVDLHTKWHKLNIDAHAAHLSRTHRALALHWEMLVERTTLHKMDSYTGPALHLKSISVPGVSHMHLPQTHLWWLPKAYLVPFWSISDWSKKYFNCMSNALLCIFAQSALRLYLKHILSKSQIILSNSHRKYLKQFTSRDPTLRNVCNNCDA